MRLNGAADSPDRAQRHLEAVAPTPGTLGLIAPDATSWTWPSGEIVACQDLWDRSWFGGASEISGV